MLPRPDPRTITTIKHAASLLSGAERRVFQAQTVLDHCNGNLSQAKTLFGWHQETVAQLRVTVQDVTRGQNPSNSTSVYLPPIQIYGLEAAEAIFPP